MYFIHIGVSLTRLNPPPLNRKFLHPSSYDISIAEWGLVTWNWPPQSKLNRKTGLGPIRQTSFTNWYSLPLKTGFFSAAAQFYCSQY